KTEGKKEVKHMSELNAQASASPQHAAIVNLGDGEGAAKPETYEDALGKLESLADSIKSVSGSGNKSASIEDLKKYKAKMSKKLAALQKQMDDGEDEPGDGAEAKSASKAEAEM